jgi:hypothetical protein
MESNLVPTDVPGLYKDVNTGMVLNKNYSELQQYMTEREKYVKHEELNKKVEDLSSAVSEIKELLLLMVKNNNGQS